MGCRHKGSLDENRGFLTWRATVRRQLLSAWMIAALVLPGSVARACTLWAAAGDEWAKGGGTLLVKNRDWTPDQHHEVRLTQPAAGFRYLGLYAIGSKSAGIKAGINEKGLVVVTATAGSIPEKDRAAMKSAKGVTSRLLSACNSVAAALKMTELFLGPQIIMMADRKEIAYVEVGPEGKFAVKTAATGVLCHTNHYLEDSTLPFNKSLGESSRVRYGRIKQLLAETPHPFDMKQFIAFSHDRVAGPDNSIFRTGSSSKVSRTVAIWIVALPPTGTPRLYLKIMDSGEPERMIEADLDDVFAGRRQDILNTPQPAEKTK